MVNIKKILVKSGLMLLSVTSFGLALCSYNYYGDYSKKIDAHLETISQPFIEAGNNINKFIKDGKKEDLTSTIKNLQTIEDKCDDKYINCNPLNNKLGGIKGQLQFYEEGFGGVFAPLNIKQQIQEKKNDLYSPLFLEDIYKRNLLEKTYSYSYNMNFAMGMMTALSFLMGGIFLAGAIIYKSGRTDAITPDVLPTPEDFSKALRELDYENAKSISEKICIPDFEKTIQELYVNYMRERNYPLGERLQRTFDKIDYETCYKQLIPPQTQLSNTVSIYLVEDKKEHIINEEVLEKLPYVVPVMSNKKSINPSAEQDAKPNKNVAKKEIVKEDPSIYEKFSKIELD